MEIEVTTKPYAGRYPFVPLEEMSTTEWGWMIDIAGCLPLKVDEALQGGDPRVVTMVAVVALHRAGKVAEADVPQAYKRLAGQPAFTTVEFIPDPADGADADPPPQETGARSSSSGPSSSTTSDSPEAAPNGSGTPPSATSPLPPVRSGI